MTTRDASSGIRVGVAPQAANINALSDYFGQLSPAKEKLLAEDQFARETLNLPDAYKGRNKYLENVLQYLITDAGSWYCTAALPFEHTDEINVAWEIFRFNKSLFDIAPNQSVPRYVSAESESRSDRLIRRGLGFIIEH